MKLLDRLARLKERKQKKATESSAENRPGSFLSPSGWVLVVLLLIVAGLGTLTFFEFWVWTKVPPALAGLWEISDGPGKGSTFEFSRNGQMEFIPNVGKGRSRKARVLVRDKTLVILETDPRTGEDMRLKNTIRELTATTLILELENGDVLKMVRLE
jgi:hypothetical protein